MHTTPYPPMLLVPLAWHNDSTGTLVRKHRFSKLGPRDSDAFFVTVFVDDESCCLSRSLTTARKFSGFAIRVQHKRRFQPIDKQYKNPIYWHVATGDTACCPLNRHTPARDGDFGLDIPLNILYQYKVDDKCGSAPVEACLVRKENLIYRTPLPPPVERM